MYCSHFGFTEKPFNVTPDPKYLYLSPSHDEILATLEYGIQERRGFIATVGEVGTGKTTLLNAVLERFDESTQTAFIFNTDMNFEQILINILFDFGLAEPDERLSKFQAIQRLNNFAIRQLTNQGTVVLIIDEAQNLDSRSMENLRLLSNLETQKHKLIQIILSGQPELDVMLKRHELRQLAQRISLKRYVVPLNEKETYEYLSYRLGIADYKGSQLFDRGAQYLIWEYSQGIPRKINILCDNALLIGYAEGIKMINAKVIKEVIKDFAWSRSENPSEISTNVSIEETGFQPQKASFRQWIAKAACFQPQKASFRQWIARAACFIIFGCIVLVIGSYMRPSNTRVARNASEFSYGRNHAGITSQATGSANISDTAWSESHLQPGSIWKDESANALQGKPESAGTSIGEGINHQHEPVNLSLNIEMDSILPTVSVKQDKRLTSQSRTMTVKRTVVVEKGDTLEMIIKEAYKKYNRKILSRVLRKNPAIQNSNLIIVGQTINLPQPADKP